MKTQRGFTLIELTMVLSLTAILLGFVTINLTRSQQSASLNAVEQVLLSDLRQQQLKAMIGDTEGRAASDSYGIHFDSNKYVLFHGTYSEGEPSNFAVNLDSNMQFDNLETKIAFKKISGEISADSVSSLVIRNTTNGKAETITINRYGVVSQVE